ncbi:MAG: GNAT family N-acetyltransferase [Spirochaetales bacterium]|nr:GNAT family N-acetyltransferase [Spirochaetales bacterium]
MVQTANIAFRLMTIDDLPVMHKWLNTPEVMEWYEKNGMPLSRVTEKYTKYITHELPTDAYIITYSMSAIGYIQTYLIRNHPVYERYVQSESGDAGLDLFIGETSYMNRGPGKIIVTLFLKQIVFSSDQVKACIVGPEPNNIRAIKTYEKAGFRYYKTIKIPEEPEPEYLMKVRREDFTCQS